MSDEMIVQNERICAGAWRIKGTRVPVTVIKAFAETDLDVETIHEEYPRLTRDQIEAALAFEEPRTVPPDNKTGVAMVWRVRPTEGGAWLVDRKLADVAALLESETSRSSDPSTPRSFTLELVHMTEEQLAGMGEFDGW